MVPVHADGGGGISSSEFATSETPPFLIFFSLDSYLIDLMTSV
jgi:hypothetical protein